jgi:hypothetical protein
VLRCAGSVRLSLISGGGDWIATGRQFLRVQQDRVVAPELFCREPACGRVGADQPRGLRRAFGAGPYSSSRVRSRDAGALQRSRSASIKGAFQPSGSGHGALAVVGLKKLKFMPRSPRDNSIAIAMKSTTPDTKCRCVVSNVQRQLQHRCLCSLEFITHSEVIAVKVQPDALFVGGGKPLQVLEVYRGLVPRLGAVNEQSVATASSRSAEPLREAPWRSQPRGTVRYGY